MSYGYIQGQEAQALVYYRKLLEVTAKPDERKKLEAIIDLLGKTIATKPSVAGVGDVAVSNNAGDPMELAAA